MSADFYLKKLEQLVGGTISGLVRRTYQANLSDSMKLVALQMNTALPFSSALPI